MEGRRPPEHRCFGHQHRRAARADDVVRAGAPSRHIATNSVIEVYREGNALRLEFSTQESLAPCCQSGSAIATLRRKSSRCCRLNVRWKSRMRDPGPTRRYRFDRRLVVVLLIVAVALGVAALILQRYSAGITPHRRSSLLRCRLCRLRAGIHGRAIVSRTHRGWATHTRFSPAGCSGRVRISNRRYVAPTDFPLRQ